MACDCANAIMLQKKECHAIHADFYSIAFSIASFVVVQCKMIIKFPSLYSKWQSQVFLALFIHSCRMQDYTLSHNVPAYVHRTTTANNS
jgi:hypothetical protein